MGLALGIQSVEGRVYWTDHDENKIYMITSEANKEATTSVSTGLDSPHNMALAPVVPEEVSGIPRTLYFRPAVVNFGSVRLGETQMRRLTIENLAGSSVNMSFPASPSGSVFRWEAFSGMLANGAERSVEIEFQPTSNAIERTTLTVTSTALGSPHSIGLIGKGPGGFPFPALQPNRPRRLDFTPNSINFGSVSWEASGR